MLRRPALALIAALTGCVAAPRPIAERDLFAAQEFSLGGRLSERITDPPTVIRQRGTAGARFRLVCAVYAVDKSLVFAKRFDALRPPGDSLAVFEGRIRPGRHDLTVQLFFEGNGRGRFAQASEYQVTVRSTQTFVLGEGELGEITVLLREPETGQSALPKTDFEFGFRPAH